MIVVRSYPLPRTQLALVAFLASVAASVARLSIAAYYPVYGSPPFTMGVGGYVGSNREYPLEAAELYPIAVNNGGVAIGNAERRNASGRTLDFRAVRWSATESAELGTFGTDSQGFASSTAFDINNAGTSVGGAAPGQDIFGLRPVRWNMANTAATELENLGLGSGYWPQDINDLGAAVGSRVFSARRFSFATFWSAAGIATPLNTISGFCYSNATAINNTGTIIGNTWTRTSLLDHALRWDTSNTATLLGQLGPEIPNSTTTTAIAINDAGVIAGTSSKHDASGNLLGTFAVRWDSTGTAATELQNPWSDPATGMSKAHTMAISANGDIVGHAVQYPTGKRAPLRWNAGSTSATVLSTLEMISPYDYGSAANAINASGAAVGYSYSRAVYWRTDGTAVDLNTLIDPNSRWFLRNATSISDTGWIAGHGYYDPDGTGGQQSYPRMFLIHIPEPTSLPCISISLIHVFLINRRRM